MKITAKQIRIIKMAQRDLGIDDDDYREMLNQWYGKRSCTQLSLDQANELIDHLQDVGFNFQPKKAGWKEVRSGAPIVAGKTARRARGKNIVALASAKELAKLDAVAALIEWQYEDGLQRFLGRRLRFKDGRVRTSRDVYLAIEAVKKLFENTMKKQHGPDWWVKAFDDPAIMEYIRRHRPEEFTEVSCTAS